MATGSFVTRQSQIEEVLNNFDFERVLELMAVHPGEWGSKNSAGETPTIKELRSFARKLLEQAAEPNQYNCSSVSCGGFHALRWPWPGSGGGECTMELIFSAEDFDA